MNHSKIYENCSLCPRNCHIDRTSSLGFCQSSSQIKAARAALHHWKNPVSAVQEAVELFSFPVVPCAVVSVKIIASAVKPMAKKFLNRNSHRFFLSFKTRRTQY